MATLKYNNKRLKFNMQSNVTLVDGYLSYVNVKKTIIRIKGTEGKEISGSANLTK